VNPGRPRADTSGDDASAGIAAVEVNVMADGAMTRHTDVVSVEEPLEIRVVHGPDDHRVERSVAVTMRTPGDDLALALGFLHGEGVVRSMDDIVDVAPAEPPGVRPGASNVVRVELAPTATFDADGLTRNVYTSSSCGVCGKASIDAVRVHIPDYAGRDSFAIDHHILGGLPEQLRDEQREFDRTGGLHASGAFDTSGRIIAVAEDVGRHNALDKLVGSFLSDGRLPMSGLGLIFSGRASFELVQKAAMAGCPFVAAIGPPSSLAVELAAEQRMTLVGFLRRDRFNIYTLPHRVLVGPASHR
jgi:FdhD protein